MYAVTQRYKAAMKRPVQKHRIKGTVCGIPFTEAHILSRTFSISGQCSDTSEVQIGQVYTSELKITLLKTLALPRYSIKGESIIPSFGLFTDNMYEYIPLGVFIISKASWATSGIEITAYDNISKLDRTFSSKNLKGTPFELMTRACTACGLELATTQTEFSAFANGTRMLELYQENDVETWRDLVSWLAQTCACNVFADRAGRIVLRAYNQSVVDSIDPLHRFNGANFEGFETHYTGISVVDIQSQMTHYYSLDIDDGTVYNLGSNPFMQTSDHEAVCRNILAALGQVRYIPFTAEMIGNPAYDLMDVLRFEGGFADGEKVSCITKYSFVYNDKYSISGAGSDPALASAKSKSDKSIAGLLSQVSEVTNSINHLLYDYNTETIEVGQYEQTVGIITYYISDVADADGHILVNYEASEPTRLIVRFYDQMIEELYSPVYIDIHEGAGTLDIPHAYLARQVGIHAAYVTMQALTGVITIGTRNVLFTINAGNYAEAVDDITMDVRDITLRQLLESSGPDQVWIIGIEDGKMLVSRREYQESYTSNPKWEGVYTAGQALDCAIEFDGQWVLNEGKDTYTLETDDQPWYFWIAPDGVLYGQPGENEEARIELAEGVLSVHACKGYSSNLYPEQDQGLIVVYIKSDGRACYRQYVYNVETGEKIWLSEYTLEASETWDDVRVHRLNDYRVAFTLSNGDHNVWLISDRTYVNQAAPPENRTDYMHSNWNGISVIDPGYHYRGAARPSQAAQQTVFIVDYPCAVSLYNGAYDIATVKIYGNAYDGRYEVATEDNQLIFTFEEGLSGVIEITVKPWTHYLTGNGVNYMFTEAVSYSWEAYNRVTLPAQSDEHTDVISGTAVNVAVKPITNLISAQSDEHEDIISAAPVNVTVKPVSVLAHAQQAENREDVIVGASTSITVTQTGESPI